MLACLDIKINVRETPKGQSRNKKLFTLETLDTQDIG